MHFTRANGRGSETFAFRKFDKQPIKLQLTVTVRCTETGRTGVALIVHKVRTLQQMVFSTHDITKDDSVVAPLYDDNMWNGEYIVVLKAITKHPHITQESIEAHKRWVSDVVFKQDKREGYYLKFNKYDSLMYTKKFSDYILDQIRRSAEVECVLKKGIAKFC